MRISVGDLDHVLQVRVCKSILAELQIAPLRSVLCLPDAEVELSDVSVRCDEERPSVAVRYALSTPARLTSDEIMARTARRLARNRYAGDLQFSLRSLALDSAHDGPQGSGGRWLFPS